MADDFDISSLPGVGPVTKNKLVEAGINTVYDLVIRGTTELKEETGMAADTCESIVAKARAHLTEIGALSDNFASATDVEKKRAKIRRISTGSEALDNLLKGGVEEKAITEVFGEFGCGKTQFCHTLAVIVQKPEKEGGLNGGVLYIDTEGTFRPDRIREIAAHHGMDPDKAIKNITVSRVIGSAQQTFIAEQMGNVVKERNIKLIISDSLTGLFRAEFTGRGTLAERQNKLGRYVKLLGRTAELYNCAVVATNQVSHSPDSFFGDPTRPVGGNIVGHASTYRLYFKKGAKNKRIVKIIDSPNHGIVEEGIQLTVNGIEDTEEYLKTKEKAEKKAAKEAEKDAKKKAKEIEAE